MLTLYPFIPPFQQHVTWYLLREVLSREKVDLVMIDDDDNDPSFSTKNFEMFESSDNNSKPYEYRIDHKTDYSL